ncbi:MAG: HypC/HybG/HupF family hydrogenase formation chaperone [Armatimonadota bacterium]|jgi:hydrogenase expression/formation protein HypC
MCVAIPSKVVEIDGPMATVELGGNRSTARIDLIDDVKLGDYVLVHAGFAISTVEEDYALETLAMLREVGML